MTAALKVTSPEEYAALSREASEKDDAGELVELPKTKAIVRMRRADMEGLALVGAIPMSLVSAAQGEKSEAGEKAKSQPTPEEVEQGAQSLVFMRQTVVENCLEPRIGFDEAGVVSFLNGAGKAVARVHKDDFLFMFDWISGQEGSDGLKSFRNRQERRASASQSRRRKVRTQPVPVAAGK
jgi:hypothetical protein